MTTHFLYSKIGVSAWFFKNFLTSEDKIFETTTCQVFTTVE